MELSTLGCSPTHKRITPFRRNRRYQEIFPVCLLALYVWLCTFGYVRSYIQVVRGTYCQSFPSETARLSPLCSDIVSSAVGSMGEYKVRITLPMQELATDPLKPEWFLLTVRFKSERSIARSLLAKGFEVFLPMHVVFREWSDRTRRYSTPLFPSRLFCRFPLLLEHKLMVLNTPGVFSVYERGGRPQPIPDSEIGRLNRIIGSRYPIESCELPKLGDVVQIGGDGDIRGVLVERNALCRVAIGFDTMGSTVVMKVPLEELKRVDGELTPHWSLKLLA